MEKEVSNNELARMIAQGFSGVDDRFNQVDERFRQVDDRFDKIESRLDDMATKHDLARLERKVDVVIDDVLQHDKWIKQLANHTKAKLAN
ncbi:MAG: hypothetical protein ACOZAJ_02115 [Patescibacteria group bacterium]